MNLTQWAADEVSRAKLSEFLASELGRNAVRLATESVKLHSARPSAAGESQLEYLALDHQFQAGFQAAFSALRQLVDVTPESIKGHLEARSRLATTRGWFARGQDEKSPPQG